MNQTIKLQARPSMGPVEQDRIKEALRLLILTFWSQGGRKDWVDIASSSLKTWESLAQITGIKLEHPVRSVKNMLKEYEPETLNQELESEFVRIFVNTRGGVSAPLYHSCYHDDQNLLMNEPALEMSRMLCNTGMDIGPDIGEPPDHLCIELEYLYFLLDQARDINNHPSRAHIHFFSRKFMLSWIEIFQQRIPETGVAGFFCSAAKITKELIEFIGQSTAAPSDHSRS